MLNVYKAAAGSGKTYILTLEYIKLLLGIQSTDTDGNVYISLCNGLTQRHRNILAVTFTNKATEEMKERIIAQLSKVKGDDSKDEDKSDTDYRDSLVKYFNEHRKPNSKAVTADDIRNTAGNALFSILHDYSNFNITTIDSFFQNILKSFTYEIGLQGEYNIDFDNDLAVNLSISKMMSKLDTTSNAQLTNWLLRYMKDNIKNGKSWDFTHRADSDAIWMLARQMKSEKYLKNRNALKEYSAERISKYYDYLSTQFSIVKEGIKNAGKELLEKMPENITCEFFKGGKKSQFTKFETFANGTIPTSDKLTAFLKYSGDINDWLKKGDIDKPGNAEIEAIINAAFNNIVLLLREYYSLKSCIKYILSLGLIDSLDNEITAYKTETNTVFLSDTPTILTKIIGDCNTPFIYEKIGMEINHYMIDEFQDTSQLQWSNFKPLLDESLASNNFNLIVGDEKQCIYRWRNSDPSLLRDTVEGIYKPDNYYIENVLDTNWRSYANIIKFNNNFFSKAAETLEDLAMSTQKCFLPKDINAENIIDVKKTFHNCTQNVSAKNLDNAGYVNVQMINGITGICDEVLERIPPIIDNLLEMGYKQSDITFITFRNAESSAIVNYLLNLNATIADPKKRYRIFSEVAMSLESSPFIRLIINVLRYADNCDSSTSRFATFYEYMRANDRDEDSMFESYFSAVEDGKALPIDDVIDSLSGNNFYEICENIISRIATEEICAKENMYIHSFLDIVIDYSASHTSEIKLFLAWWESKKDKFFVSVPDNNDSMQAVTIHKSKGLEYKCVIMPFVNWAFKTRNNDIIWCTPNDNYIDKPPIIPVEVSKDLPNSRYFLDYYKELNKVYIDNLNLAYVAFTRAVRNLYIIAPRPNDDKKENSPASGIANLLSATITEIKDTLANVVYKSGDGIETFEIGELCKQETEEKEKEAEPEAASSIYTMPAYKYYPFNNRAKLNIDTEARHIFNENQRLGLMMHDILSGIKSVDDIDSAIKEYRRYRDCCITDEQVTEIKHNILQYISKTEAKEWFTPGIKVLNETSILRNGKRLRPDRVVIDKDNSVTVIDYKFGDKESIEYIKQVSTYMALIREMGYSNVIGKIWYLSLDKIITVNV